MSVETMPAMTLALLALAASLGPGVRATVWASISRGFGLGLRVPSAAASDSV